MQFKLLTILCCMLSFSVSGFSNEADTKQPEKFNAGDLIIGHITDSYSWHILSIGDKHVSVPLPVILINDGKMDVFMSSKFHHGHESYKGYKLIGGGVAKEEIICVDAEGKPTGMKPVDLSITKTAASIMISCFLLILLLFAVKKSCIRNKGKAPKGLQSLMEVLILFIRDQIVQPIIGEKKYEKYLPYILTLFIFIFFCNLMGLIPFFPGGANVTGNIAVTGVLAVITFLITTFSSNKHYWKDIFNTPGVPWWLKFPLPLMPIVEFMGMLTKPFVLMVRLFANITAGHIVVLGFITIIFIFGNMIPALGYGVSVISILFSVFISLLELLVAFIQAYVFAMLSALYISMAIEEPEKEPV